MHIFGIDPGPQKSGWVLYNEKEHTLDFFGIDDNYSLLKLIEYYSFQRLVIEEVGNFGNVVGKTVFNTSYWSGRFAQKYYDLFELEPIFIKRQTIKSVIAGSVRAGDSQVRQAIINQFLATGGGKVPQIGTKNQPGPLYGVKSHTWSALAVVLAFVDLRESGQNSRKLNFRDE